MANFQETDYSKYIAAFQQLVGACIELESAYQPEHQTLKLEALTSLLFASRAALEEVKDTKTRLAKAIHARDVCFQPIATLANDVLEELIAANASRQATAEARNHVRYIQANGLHTLSKNNIGKEIGTESKNDHTAVTPYHSKIIDHFAQLVHTVTKEPNYLPNRHELKVIMLTLVLQELRSRQTAVVFAELSLNKALLSCAQAICGNNGLVAIANEVVEHITTITRASGAIYKKVNALKFIPHTEKKGAVVSLK